MEESLAMLIVGAVCTLIGLIMNLKPVEFNENVFGRKIEEGAEGIAASMRLVIGGGLIAIGFIAIYNRDLPAVEAEGLLFSIGVGLSIFLATVLSGYFRKYMDHIPVPPVVTLSALIAICFYASLT